VPHSGTPGADSGIRTASEWDGLGAGSPLRPYQTHAVAQLVRALAAPGSRACLVAPPGSGKTRTALHVAAALERPVDVRVPTLALARQWRERIATSIVDLTGAGRPPPFEVTTYAAGAPLTPRSLLVLDEAHHLGGAWGEQLARRLTDDHRVLGLTATPPLEGASRRGFERLVGDEPVCIETPPLVREGALSPYQDLVWPVLCDPEEAGEAHDAWRALERARDAMEPRLSRFVAGQLREDLMALTEARFRHQDALLVALCRVHLERGGPLPADLPRDPELTAEPTLTDWATVLWASGDERARTAVRGIGFRPAKGDDTRLVASRDPTWSGLVASRARVRGLVEVLDLEHRHRGDQVRALVLTERDAATAGRRASARTILQQLVADPRSDALDPVLVTGSVLWVDDDLVPRIRPHLPAVAIRDVGGHHEFDVSGWSTADRVAAVTELFRRGVTRCVVGTRHLLGEGWDCPAVNVVVDLTGIRAFVTVHQVRGRGMRADPDDPSKVASLWEIPVVVPGLPSGDQMLERLRQRHQLTFGVDDHGRVVRGIARIDPALAGTASELAAALPEVRRRMRRRLEDASGVADRWAVGSDYRDALAFVVERSEERVGGGPVVERALQAPQLPEVVRRPPPEFPRAPVASAGAAAAIALVAAVGEGLVAAGLLLAVAVVLVVRSVGPWWRDRHAWTHRIASWEAARPPAPIGRARAVFDALLAVGAAAGALVEESDRVWVDGENASSRRFARALIELEGPIAYPRYVLLAEDGGRTALWPVPHELGADRSKALAFAAAWAEHLGPCEVVFARRGRGRALLEAAWRQPPRVPPDIDEVWA